MESDDDIKRLWAQSKRELEASLRLNTLLLQQSNLERAGSSLGRFSRGLWVELAATLAVVALVGSFAADHVRELRFLIPAVIVDLYAIALVVLTAMELALARSVSYEEPVVAAAGKLERLRLMRVRSTLANLLFAPLMWLPIAIVGMRAFFGADLYAAGWEWLAANLIFGLAVIPGAVFAAKFYRKRLASSSALRALADAVAGSSLIEAANAVDTIRRFTDDGYSVSTGSLTGRS